MTEPTEDKPVPLRKLLFLFIAQASVFTICGLALWSLSERSLAEFVVLDWSDTLLGLGLGLALIASGWTTYRFAPHLTEHLARLQSKNFEFLSRPFPFYAVVVLSICAGVGEEALFRGGIQTYLTDVIGAHLAILIAAALFTVIHLAKPLISAMIFAIGMLFGYIYWLTDSLLLVMIAHTIYDIFAIYALKKQLQRLGIFAEDDAVTAVDPQSDCES